MKKLFLCSVLLIMSLVLTGCRAFTVNSTTEETIENASRNTEAETSILFDSVFQERKLSDKEQAELVGNTLLNAESENDTKAILALFAPSIAKATPSLESDIVSFQEFIQGNVISIEMHGPSAHEFRDGDTHIKEYIASFDITSTETEYRIAMKFLTVDAMAPENIGLHSIYVVLAENTDTKFAYWGGHEWNAGIVIE